MEGFICTPLSGLTSKRDLIKRIERLHIEHPKCHVGSPRMPRHITYIVKQALVDNRLDSILDDLVQRAKSNTMCAEAAPKMQPSVTDRLKRAIETVN